MRRKLIWVIVVLEFLLIVGIFFLLIWLGRRYLDDMAPLIQMACIVAVLLLFIGGLCLFGFFVKWFDGRFPPKKGDFTLNHMFGLAGGRLLLCMVAIGFVGSLIYTAIDCSHKHSYDDREGRFEYYE